MLNTPLKEYDIIDAQLSLPKLIRGVSSLLPSPIASRVLSRYTCQFRDDAVYQASQAAIAHLRVRITGSQTSTSNDANLVMTCAELCQHYIPEFNRPNGILEQAINMDFKDSSQTSRAVQLSLRLARLGLDIDRPTFAMNMCVAINYSKKASGVQSKDCREIATGAMHKITASHPWPQRFEQMYEEHFA
jgi:hypothetical protein